MFNVGSGEFLIILLVALVVLGPTRLPGALRQIGQFLGEARKLSSNFQNEVQEAMKDPVKVVTGQDTPKMPRSGKELLGFAVPEPFASQKADDSESNKTESDDSESTGADTTAQAGDSAESESVIEPAELPSKKTGPTFDSAAPAKPVEVELEPQESSAAGEARGPVDDDTSKTAAQEPLPGADERDDEVPMFGDR